MAHITWPQCSDTHPTGPPLGTSAPTLHGSLPYPLASLRLHHPQIQGQGDRQTPLPRCPYCSPLPIQPPGTETRRLHFQLWPEAATTPSSLGLRVWRGHWGEGGAPTYNRQGHPGLREWGRGCWPWRRTQWWAVRLGGLPGGRVSRARQACARPGGGESQGVPRPQLDGGTAQPNRRASAPRWLLLFEPQKGAAQEACLPPPGPCPPLSPKHPTDAQTLPAAILHPEV